jgi:dihydroflavonol-4-reductase
MNSSMTVVETKPNARGTVLVTGGSGFIGQHLVNALHARGRHVRILDRRPPRSARAELQYVAGSACDPHVADKALRGVAEIYHLAGMPGLWAPKKQDFDLANRLATEVMLAAARKHQVARFLYCSTESVLFGRERSARVITEETQTSVDEMAGTYTRSKKAAEELALQAAAAGVPVVIANPTMPIGPHHYELTPPTAMIRHFLRRRIAVHIKAVMNIVDVRDVATGLILAMERGQIGQRYILGGENTSLQHLLENIAATTGRTCVPLCIPTPLAAGLAAMMEFIADRTWQVPAASREGVEIARRSRPLSSEKASRELGYTPRNLNEALWDTISWLETGRIGAQQKPNVAGAGVTLGAPQLP